MNTAPPMIAVASAIAGEEAEQHGPGKGAIEEVAQVDGTGSGRCETNERHAQADDAYEGERAPRPPRHLHRSTVTATRPVVTAVVKRMAPMMSRPPFVVSVARGHAGAAAQV